MGCLLGTFPVAMASAMEGFKGDGLGGGGESGVGGGDGEDGGFGALPLSFLRRAAALPMLVVGGVR